MESRDPVKNFVGYSMFLTAGLLIFFLTVPLPWWKSIATRSWVATPCEILSSEIDRQPDGASYRIRLFYRFEYGGNRYHGDRYDTSERWSSLSSQAAIKQRYPVGSKVECFVNPDYPTESVLERSFSAPWLYVALPALFVVVGVAGLLDEKRRKRTPHRER